MPWRFLPPFLDLESASLALELPARTTLRRVGPAKVTTSDASGSTALRLTLGPTLLRLTFEPHLVIDLPPLLGDMGLQSVEVDFRTGTITPNLWVLPGSGLPVGRGTAMDEARVWMRDLITSTPIAMPPYDPTADHELVLTVQQVLVNLEASAEIPIAPRSASLSARVVVREAISAEAGPGGIRLPAGAVIRLLVDLAGGTPKQIQESPRILRVVVECDGAVLRQAGADQAQVGRFVLRPGGVVEVEQVRALGEAGQIAGIESLIRLVGALSGGAVLDPAQIEPSGVERLVKQEIAAALQPALLAWVKENAGAVAGLDIAAVLGIEV